MSVLVEVGHSHRGSGVGWQGLRKAFQSALAVGGASLGPGWGTEQCEAGWAPCAMSPVPCGWTQVPVQWVKLLANASSWLQTPSVPSPRT